MASAVIHLAVAKELEKYLKIENKKDYNLGAIAPDIAQQLKIEKTKSHFIYNTKSDIPNIKLFKEKYKNFMNNSFELGYFTHLYTDKLWFDGFIDSLTYSNSIKLLDGTIIHVPQKEIKELIYNDYTNLNTIIIDKYNIDLSLFYEEYQKPNTSIEEVPIDKLNILIDKMGVIIENSNLEKSYIFDITLIDNFINTCVEKIIKELKI